MAAKRTERVCAACCGLLLLVWAAGCGGGGAPRGNDIASGSNSGQIAYGLTAADVQAVINKAAESVDVPLVIAVTDRSGNILGVYRKAGAPATASANFGVMADAAEVAVGLARTASFFSNDQAPLSSRTVRFISGVHFPPGIIDAPTAPLYGIENNERGCSFNVAYLPGQALPQPRSIDGLSPSLGVITGKPDIYDSDSQAVNPGGVPLFRNGRLVGGVGVSGAAAGVVEFAAYSGAIGAGFVPTPAPPGVVVVGGVSLPFVNQTTRPSGLSGGAANGSFTLGPLPSPGPSPEGDLIARSAGTVPSPKIAAS